MALNIDACTAQHIGDREEQQDRVGIFPHPRQKGTLLAVLADGMGGHTGGAMAAEQVVQLSKHAFMSGDPSPSAVRELLEQSINDAHDGIKLSAITSEQDPHSTACLFVLQPGQADWSHCGDSRIYHFRNGERIQRSVDHSLVMRKMVLPGYLTEEQAESHPNKNILVSCLGDADRPEIDLGGTEPLQGGDCFLLCSDGLWAYFKDDELGRILADNPPRQAASLLIDAARERAKGRGDNCSLAIVKLTEIAEEPKGIMPPPWKK